MKIIAISTSLVFCILSFWHIYWAFGGKLGKDKAIPQVSGKPVFKPGVTATLAVAMALFICALVALVLGFEEYLDSPYGGYFSYAAWGLAGVFFLRTVGDFKHVGFFKKVRNTEFAKYDSLFYTPLCLCLGVALILLA